MNTYLKAKNSFLLILFLFLNFSLAVEAASPINTLKSSFFGKDTNTAISGYDPVAYFIQNQAVEGSEKYITEWKGANWRFANKENLTKFKADPTKYAPQYGGYCAYGVSQNYLVKVDPEQFSIINNKLYLNYSRSVKNTWLQNPHGYIKNADKNFPDLIK